MKIDNLELLVPEAPEPQDSWRWGKIVAMSPLSALLDGDETPILLTDALEAPKLHDRVLILFSGTRAMIVGVAGGEHSQVVRVEDETKEALGDLAEQIDRIDTLSPEDRAKLAQTVADLADAKLALQAASETLQDWDEHRLPALQDELAANRERIAEAEADLESAFPTGPFNVGSEIEGSATATLTAAALDAQGKATDAANAARVAAEQYAAGEISDAELRAAQDAADKAEAARAAAVQTAATDAQSKANAARDAAIQTAAADAQLKADEAAAAAQQAAIAHANGEISDAELRAAQEAERLAGLAADAALDVAKSHADTAAEDARDSAVQAAALDATTKANNAAAAAQQAAIDHAAGEISDAELRAAQEAERLAGLAADAAVTAAKSHADTAAEDARVAAITAAAADATTKANNAKTAAETAAKAYADGEITDAELRAATDAADKATAARDAAITAAQTYANTAAGAAETAAISAAQTYADKKKTEAIDAAATDAKSKADAAQAAAISAAEEHADLVARGASADAIAAAALDAQAKADAAETAAKTHANAQAAAAETAAKTHATNEAARVKQEALAAAATDAQAKATAAADAAQQAAEEYALAQAEGLSEQALADAKADAKSKADAARDAAITAAQTYADARKNEAIDAAALTAQTKADVAKQAAIDAAAADAQAKASAAASAAETAAKEHADLVAQGASADAIAAAAQDAKSKADAAQAAAIAAAATDAQTKANKAKTDAISAAATDAQTKANKAKTDAISAAATDAQAKADAAADAAETAAKTYALAQAQGLSGQALADAKADATAKANAAEQAAKDAAAADALSKANTARDAAIDAAKADLDALEVGGRNLYQQSGGEYLTLWNTTYSPELVVEDGRRAIAFNSSNNIIYTGRRGAPVIGVGETITFSFWAKGSKPMSLGRVYLGGGSGNSSFINGTMVSEEWQRFSVTHTPTSTLNVNVHMYPQIRQFENGEIVGHDTFFLTDMKLERGSKATDWTPAPEDVDAGIEGALDVATTADGKATTAAADAGTAKTNAATAVSTASAADTKAGQAVTTAGQANTKAGQAVTTANTAKSTADTAKSTADTAKSTADTAKSRADAAARDAGNAQSAAAVAMTTADGKNTTTYSDVATYPGATPANNPERKRFDMHRNRASRTFTSNGTTYQSGEILAEWMWSGTAWVPVHMGDGILRSLDVGKLTAGTANLQTAVIQKLTAGLARLIEVDADKIVTGTIKGAVLDFNTIWAGVANLGRIITKELLADGAVTARTLNVVPESGTGGVEILPPGLRIIPPGEGAGTAVSLRVDEENTIAFAKDNENTFAVNEFGDITGRSLDVRGELKEDGVPIGEMLKALPQGYYARGEMSGTSVRVAAEAGRIVMASFRTPPENRLMKVTVSLRPNVNATRHAEIAIRQSEGLDVKATNSQKKVWPVVLPLATGWEASQVFTVDEWGWPYNETITLGVFAKSITASQNIQFSSNHGQMITVEDVGLPLELQANDAYVPSTGGGSGGGGSAGDTGKRYHDGKFYPASNMVRSYRGNNSHYNWNEKMLFHGYNLSANGRLRSMAIFNRTAVNLLTTGTGTEMVSGHIKLYNSHTWSSSGMTVRVGYVGAYTSPPGTWNGTTNFTWIGNYTVGRGGVLTIPLTSTHLARIKSGAFRGIALVSNTNTASHYGYFNASRTELYIKVRK